MYKTLSDKSSIFYIVIFIAIVFILYSNPFLRYPYDMIHHLIVIDEFYVQLKNPIQKVVGIWANNILIMIPTGETEPIVLSQNRYLWHYLWAIFFEWVDINSTQMFLRAKIIHVIQTIISLGSIYYFSNVVLRNIFKDISLINLKWISLWSVLIWVSIFATFSVVTHQVWVMWYSLNYQISLPLFWYMLGLTLVLLLEHNSWKVKFFFILQILLISRFILQVHSMEFMYYMMHMCVFLLLFIDKVYFLMKKYFFIIVPTITTMIYVSMNFRPSKSPIFNYLSFEKFPELYEKIMRDGSYLVHGFNRASASINELIVLSGIMGILFLIYHLYDRYHQKKETYINSKMILFIAFTSLFILIPLFQFSGGLFAAITYANVVNRLYYSSSIFLVLPIVVYGLLSKYKISLLPLNIIMITLLLAVSILSKHTNILHHNYYKNLVSIKNSFRVKKVSFNLSDTQIEIVKEKIQNYEKSNSTHKTIRYYARADIAFVIKYLFHKNVYWEGRRKNPDYIKIYKEKPTDAVYKNILFETPKSFPTYLPYR